MLSIYMNQMVNRNELIRSISKKTGYSQKDIKSVLDTLEEVVVDNIANKESVKLFNGVSFEGRYIDTHTARNPRTGEIVSVPGRLVPKVKITNAFKSQF